MLSNLKQKLLFHYFQYLFIYLYIYTVPIIISTNAYLVVDKMMHYKNKMFYVTARLFYFW